MYSMVTGVSLNVGGGFPVGIINMTTGYFHKNKRKLKPKAQVLNSLPTNWTYPATWNLLDSPDGLTGKVHRCLI